MRKTMLLVLVGCLSIVACGQKGELTRPDAAEPEQAKPADSSEQGPASSRTTAFAGNTGISFDTQRFRTETA